ncbi:hypothetical protein LTR40_002584 [Exophiala xenobiotica]|nr:hypothetical protein LTR40_002584 [Exophiala xenobiotica]
MHYMQSVVSNATKANRAARGACPVPVANVMAMSRPRKASQKTTAKGDFFWYGYLSTRTSRMTSSEPSNSSTSIPSLNSPVFTAASFGTL